MKYVFIDENALKGKNFYRIVMIDSENKKTYSSIAYLLFQSLNQINVYPNPSSDKITVEGVDIGDVVKVINLIGSTVYQSTQTIQQDLNISLQSFNSGLYYIIITKKDGTSQSVKVIKL